MKSYLLVMTGRAKDWRELPPEEMQRLMERYHEFVETLKGRHGFEGGSALNQAGFGLRAEGDRILVDGPFSETKEVLNGYMRFRANDLAEALELAKLCPALTHGEQVQVFELTEH